MSDLFKNSYIAPEKDLVSLSVCNVGYQKCEPLYTWGPGIRNHYLIHYVITGKGYFKVHGKTYELKSGDCFLVYRIRKFYIMPIRKTLGFTAGSDFLEAMPLPSCAPLIFLLTRLSFSAVLLEMKFKNPFFRSMLARQ